MLQSMSIPLATAEEAMTIGLSLMLVGMVVVFIALTVIGLTIVVLGRVFAVPEPATVPVAPAPAGSRATEPPPASAPEPVVDVIPAHHLAAIAAAVAVLAGRAARVRSVRFVRQTSSHWAEQGRAAIHGSHNVRKS